MNKGLDVLKFVCALLVVYIHTYCYEPAGGVIKDIICPIGVPFFFIVSGFFLGRGLEKNNGEQKTYIRRYITRLLIMYSIWSLLTLPVGWYITTQTKPDDPIWFYLMRMVRLYFLVGSLGIYWYILSLIYGSFLIFYASYKRKMKWLYAFAVVGFVIGFIYESGVVNGTLLYHAIHVIFGSSRNVINCGLMYMCIGFASSRVKVWKGKWLGFILMIMSFVVSYYMKNYLTFEFWQFPASVALFVFGVQWTPRISDSVSLTFRKLSTAIYLLHFPFILVFDLYLKRGTVVDYFCALAFAIVCYYLVIIVMPKKISKQMFGG